MLLCEFEYYEYLLFYVKNEKMYASMWSIKFNYAFMGILTVSTLLNIHVEYKKIYASMRSIGRVELATVIC
jgi:hypothetical protein